MFFLFYTRSVVQSGPQYPAVHNRARLNVTPLWLQCLTAGKNYTSGNTLITLSSRGSVLEVCHLMIRVVCPPAAGRFLSPFLGCDGLPRRAFHSSPVSLSAHNLPPASENAAQIPDWDKGKICLIYCQMPLKACYWSCLKICVFLEHKRKSKAWAQNWEQKPVHWFVYASKMSVYCQWKEIFMVLDLVSKYGCPTDLFSLS